MNQICDYTNGNIHFFKKFRIETQYKALFNRISKTLTRKLALEAVMRTRFSNGYKISNFITPILISNGDLMVMSTLDEDTSYAINLDLPESTTQNQSTETSNSFFTGNSDRYCFVQSALLYTHYDGTRRIRVHNLCLPLTSKSSEIHDKIDSECLSAFYLKIAIDKIFKTRKMTNSILSVENTYKCLISSVLSNIHTHTKELPDHLLYLPLYFLGFMKNRVCCRDEIGLKLDIDTSNYMRIKIQKLNVNDVMSFIYPKIYQLHHLLIDKTLGTVGEDGLVSLPGVFILT